MKKLINRCSSALWGRGVINNDTEKADFILKMQEESREVVDAYILNEPEERYIEELTDLATVCIMQITHLGYDFEEEFKKVVEKNERRAGI